MPKALLRSTFSRMKSGSVSRRMRRAVGRIMLPPFMLMPNWNGCVSGASWLTTAKKMVREAILVMVSMTAIGRMAVSDFCRRVPAADAKNWSIG